VTSNPFDPEQDPEDPDPAGNPSWGEPLPERPQQPDEGDPAREQPDGGDPGPLS
jgi:hypothetical protein